MLVPTAITTVRLDSSRVTNVARRKPDADERRRLLCDAAIDLLAEGGAKNLSHLKVDRQARVADGTTSFYYRTAAALIRGVVDRVAELDAADFESLMGDQAEPDRSTPGSLLSRLAEAMLRSANNPELSRARARIELVLMCQRDPELRKQFEEGMARYIALSEEAVVELQQDADPPPDRELIREQAFAVTTFANGYLFRVATLGDSQVASVAQLKRYLHALVAGLALEYNRSQAPPSSS